MAALFYKEVQADKSIADFVKLYWQFKNTSAEAKHYTVLPDGFFDLVIYISNNEINNISLYGVWSKQINVVVPGFTTVLGITFSPIAAEYVFKDTIVDIFNNSKQLNHSFFDINTLPFNDFSEFTNQFSTLISAFTAADNRKVEIFRLLFASSGTLSVEELSKKAFWSSRQINRYFQQNFGLTLKTYANILRCSSTYTHIEEGKLSSPILYYDQSHFIKEIKKYTGSNPKELHKNENDRFLQFSDLLKP